MTEETKKEMKSETTAEKLVLNDHLVISKHKINLAGKEIEYTVTTGTIILREETSDREKEFEGEKPSAEFFFVAYSKDGENDPAKRPLTFSFNGGPGSSSVDRKSTRLNSSH